MAVRRNDPLAAALQQVSSALLELHRLLIAVARAEYESFHGPVSGPNHLLQLLMNDAGFTWLRELSGLIVRIDELAESEDLTRSEAAKIRTAIDSLIASPEGSDFARRYAMVLQNDPAVLQSHAEVRRALRGVPEL
jgi:hypothetical protein